MSLRELVLAWQAQDKKCSDVFNATLAEINRLLDSVGGFATTSADKDGFCRDYIRFYEPTFGGGVCRTGDDPGGQHAGKVAPYEPEVGDKCFALDRAWREEAYKLTAAINAVRAYIEKVGGGKEPEHVALALIKDDEEH
jgi:hypothetical protein